MGFMSGRVIFVDERREVKRYDKRREGSGLSGDVYGRITAEIVHGRDSYFPGILVFGVNPADRIVCDCGNWRPPEKEQVLKTRANLNMNMKFSNSVH